MSLAGLDLTSVGMIIDSLADGVYITDLDRKILYWNRTAEEITGWPASAIVGRSCFDNVLAHEDLDGNALCGEDCCPLHRAITHGRASQVPVIIFARHRSGVRIPVAVAVAPLRDAEGSVVGGIESFRDLGPLMRDLERARVIQSRAMHASLPDDPRVTFALQNTPQEFVSGDFYRVEQIHHGHYVLLISDVMGHGIASALYTMQIRSLWEDARSLLIDPAAFLSHLNEKLCDLAEEDGFFATAFCATLDLDHNVLTYVNAAHPPPVLLRDGVASPLEAGHGIALGLVDDAAYENVRLTLRPLDVLVAYTDGAVEVLSDDGEELGVAGFLQLVQGTPDPVSTDGLAAIRDALLGYARGVAFEDDLTFVAFRIESGT